MQRKTLESIIPNSKRNLMSGMFAMILFYGFIFLDQNPFAQAQEPHKYQHFDKVISIILENTDYADAIEDPYFQQLMTQGALLSQFKAITHPSYPNYLAMTAGTTFGVNNDNQKTFTSRSIVDLLEEQGLTWKSYAEDYPGNCFLGATKGKYARKHVPLLSFKSIQKDPQRCAKVVSSDQFMTDWERHQLPTYSFFTPNMDDDAHDTNLTTASDWLKKFLTPLLEDPERMKGILIEITFDEAESYLGHNRIFTLLIGPSVKSGVSVQNTYNIYSFLRTVEDNYSLGTLGNEDKNASAIQGIWK